MIYIELAVLQAVIVFVLDQTDLMANIKRFISGVITKGKIKTDNYLLKPFDCSLCMTFWCGLIYVLVVNKFSIIMLGYLCLLAFLTRFTNNVFQRIQGWINMI